MPRIRSVCPPPERRAVTWCEGIVTLRYYGARHRRVRLLDGTPPRKHSRHIVRHHQANGTAMLYGIYIISSGRLRNGRPYAEGLIDWRTLDG